MAGLKLHALGLEHGGMEVPKPGMRGGLELACAGLRIGGLEAPSPACIGAERNWASVSRGLALGKLATCAGAGAGGPGGRMSDGPCARRGPRRLEVGLRAGVGTGLRAGWCWCDLGPALEHLLGCPSLSLG
ncbi:unnamed protein product [Prunus armeniaca]